jgi:predicted membrane metal-binding protein
MQAKRTKLLRRLARRIILGGIICVMFSGFSRHCVYNHHVALSPLGLPDHVMEFVCVTKYWVALWYKKRWESHCFTLLVLGGRLILARTKARQRRLPRRHEWGRHGACNDHCK